MCCPANADGDDAWLLLARILDLGLLVGESVASTDFVYMGTTRSGAVDIHRFKHARTRHYLNVDRAGHTYRYLARSPTGPASYVPWTDLRSALAHAKDWSGAARWCRARQVLSQTSIAQGNGHLAPSLVEHIHPGPEIQAERSVRNRRIELE